MLKGTTMQKQAKATKPAPVAAPATKPAPVAAPAAPGAAQPAQPPVQVALRGGVTVASVKAGKPYRSTAPHNVAWWQTIAAALAKGQPAPVAPMLLHPQHNPQGVPARFVGYCVRRGYLVPA